MGTKRTFKSWTAEEQQEMVAFFSLERSREEKANFSKKLGRTWSAIYNRHWDMKNPEAKIKAKARTKELAKLRDKKAAKAKNERVIVTHLGEEVRLATRISIGEVIIETHSPKIKINDVLIEV